MMEPTNTTIPSAEQKAETHKLRMSGTDQATSSTMVINKLPNDIGNRKSNNSCGLKLAGAGMTEFHRYNDLPLELRIRIMEVNMLEDNTVSNPRIIKIHLEWSPDEDECFGNHDSVADQPWEENSDEDEDEDDRRHFHVYHDHDNFAWKIADDSEVRRSHRPLIPYFTVSKECKKIVQSFIVCHMGRRCRAFWSPELRNLPLSPQDDIFYIDCDRAWEAVNEWGSTLLYAVRDALQMRNFMIDFPTFHGLVKPSMREKDDYLLALSNKEPYDYFRGESSMRVVFKNAAYIAVIATADKDRITNYQSLAIWDSEDAQKDDVPGLLPEMREILQSIWSEKNTEFNGLRGGNGDLPVVFWATVPEKELEDECDDQEIAF